MRNFILLVLIALVNKSTAKHPDASEVSNHCGDCSGFNNDHLFTTTGYACHGQDTFAVEKNFTESESGYPQCVPNIYELVSPIKYFCCFWSAQLGCTILVGQKHYDKYGSVCTPCYEHCASARNGVRRTDYGKLASISLALAFLLSLARLP